MIAPKSAAAAWTRLTAQSSVVKPAAAAHSNTSSASARSSRVNSGRELTVFVKSTAKWLPLKSNGRRREGLDTAATLPDDKLSQVSTGFCARHNRHAASGVVDRSRSAGYNRHRVETRSGAVLRADSHFGGTQM